MRNPTKLEEKRDPRSHVVSVTTFLELRDEVIAHGGPMNSLHRVETTKSHAHYLQIQSPQVENLFFSYLGPLLEDKKTVTQQ